MAQPRIRRALSRANPYYDGPVSDHFDGRRFHNPGGHPLNGFSALLRWQFGKDTRARWPQQVTSPHQGTRPEARVDDLRVTMVGHATLLIQTAGINILTDPHWSERASPVQFAGPKRVTQPGIAFDDLPKIDLVLLSHNHYDHLDTITLRRLQAAHTPQVITPLGNDTLLRRLVPGIRVSAHDWGAAVPTGPLTVHLDPCHHWSARGTRDRAMALWASMTIEGPAGRILFIGDTGFDRGRPYEVVRRHGPLRLAILPVGAYEPRWFMSPQHQDPAEAVEGFLRCGAEAAIGHHWGTFQLTNEEREAPPQALAAALAARGIAPERFRALHAGEVWNPAGQGAAG
ncbi:MBL fold metallo-hydrolase [Seohaeicola zhoushanensis]|uniref:Membrane protein n=1 Tax=Seohaeicola zhoushanensis TaxID=1569283 RepID=A0A8J3GUJ3_9RHOB|nr:MBL fold metallo-hydrolase [Seohaeicola zhoushanensis]GHF36386.1 membrane protein [Seohaeicola zhoushanensis]